MNPKNLGICGDENGGTDLNRNWGVDWMAMVELDTQEKCGDFWSGSESFSEPETKAVRNFIEQNKQTLKFIINYHSWGQAFIWPFNGREENDIKIRAPGYLEIFRDL